MRDGINWNIIRSIEGDQKAGFEELVCQIARKEKKENYTRFVQLGIKDGGLECYWELDDGNIIGWQAKYFLSSFSNSQWSQIKESVKRASETYGEKLDTMIIAVPYKPTHAMQEKADKKILKWKDEFENCPEIEYWWAGDLNNFLSQEKYDGFRKFWFNELQFNSKWFKAYTQNSIENLGDKYDRKVNIKTDNQIYFDSIYRNEEFRQFIYQNIGHDIFLLKDSLSKLNLFFVRSTLDTNLVDKCLNLANKIQDIILSFKFEDDFENKFDGFEDFNFKEIFVLLDEIEQLIYEIQYLFSDSTYKKEVHHYTNEIIYILEEFYQCRQLKFS